MHALDDDDDDGDSGGTLAASRADARDPSESELSSDDELDDDGLGGGVAAAAALAEGAARCANVSAEPIRRPARHCLVHDSSDDNAPPSALRIARPAMKQFGRKDAPLISKTADDLWRDASAAGVLDTVRNETAAGGA